MLEFLLNNWQGISSLIGGAILFIYRRPLARLTLKKEQSNLDSNTISNLERSMKLYVDILNDVEKRYEEKLSKRDAEIKFLEGEISKLKQRIDELENR